MQPVAYPPPTVAILRTAASSRLAPARTILECHERLYPRRARPGRRRRHPSHRPDHPGTVERRTVPAASADLGAGDPLHGLEGLHRDHGATGRAPRPRDAEAPRRDPREGHRGGQRRPRGQAHRRFGDGGVLRAVHGGRAGIADPGAHPRVQRGKPRRRRARRPHRPAHGPGRGGEPDPARPVRPARQPRFARRGPRRRRADLPHLPRLRQRPGLDRLGQRRRRAPPGRRRRAPPGRRLPRLEAARELAAQGHQGAGRHLRGCRHPAMRSPGRRRRDGARGPSPGC